MIQNLDWWLFTALLPIAYWLAPARYRPVLLTGVSLFVLVALSPLDMLAMVAISGLVYVACSAGQIPVLAFADGPLQAIAARTPFPGRATLPVAAILFYLFWFKYLLPVTSTFGISPQVANVAVPLGISYFSFKLIHYAIEGSRDMLPPHKYQDYMSWLFLMPTFTAGPIERFEHYLKHRESEFHIDYVIEGGTRIIQGLVKKFVLGFVVDQIIKDLTGNDLIGFIHGTQGSPGVPAVWAVLLLSVLAAYLDFSAYTDIALGASRLFGLRIMENFDYPFLATNLGDFWRRYHMTLVNWCRAYVYMPFVGLTRNPYAAVTLTFAVIGLWHSGSLGWLCWGLWQGLGQVVMQLWVRWAQRRKIKYFKATPGKLTGWAMTMAYVSLGDAFVIPFHVGGFGDSLTLIARGFGY